MANLTIGKLAEATGVKVETIRYYERAGLIAPPARTSGNYRAYDAADLERLRFIRRTRDLGFALEEVRAMLNLASQHDQPCGTIDAIAAEHLRQVDHKIADLQGLRRELSTIIASCAGGSMDDCRILEAFGDRP